VLLPRTVTRGWRFTAAFYRMLWGRIWRPIGERIGDFRKRDTFLGFFGPLSIVILLQVWAGALIFGWGLLDWGLWLPVVSASRHHLDFGGYLYFSGVTFFTLGYGDITPASGIGRVCAVLESGMGFGFLAIVIGYMPVMYGAFSRREATVSLLDARAGSPPTALEMLRRHADAGAVDELCAILKDIERWISELLESHLSYPYLALYRSQHDDQSWISALVVAMDTCALIMTGLSGVPKFQARMTFAMGRHAVVDMCLIMNQAPAKKYLSRLSSQEMDRIVATLAEAGIGFTDEASAEGTLAELRRSYEPYAITLARSFSFSLPPFVPAEGTADDWQRSVWERAEHF
jgi:hypothetical protein